MHGIGGQRVFPGPGHQRDRTQRHLARRIGGAQHLKAELRHAVAKSPQRQILEHYISDAAIGGRRIQPLHGGDLWVGQLVGAAGIDPQVQVSGRNLDPIRPDPADPGNRAFAQRNGKRDRVAVFIHFRLAAQPLTPATASADGFQKLRGPDDMPAHTNAAPDLRHGRALAGAGQPQPVQSPLFNHLRPQTHQPLVDDPAQRRAHGPANHHARQPERSTAKTRAECRAHR